MILSILFPLRQLEIKADIDQINDNFNTSEQTEVESAEVAPPCHCLQDHMIQAQGGLLSKI